MVVTNANTFASWASETQTSVALRAFQVSWEILFALCFSPLGQEQMLDHSYF